VESENRQSWLLIAIAALGLVLGAIALVIAFSAKSASDDAASGKQVEEVSTELSNLVDRLGIAEASLTGQQKALQGKAKNAVRESRSAVTNLSSRLERVERKTKALEADAQSTATLAKRVGSLESQVDATDSRVTAVNQRVTKLSRRVDSSTQASSTQVSGGQSGP
jgi:DNA repair ATPase RecN